MLDYSFLLNTAVALLLGVVIGAERQYGRHPAGIRTNALVSLGSALFVSLSLLLEPEGSPTRIAAQVVSGIGFIGGGAILREGVNVRGMNTAATLWCSGAVGTLAGAGFILYAAAGTAAILVIHFAFGPLAHAIDRRTQLTGNVETHYQIRVACQRSDLGRVRASLMHRLTAHKTLLLQGLSVADGDKADSVVVVATLFALTRDDQSVNNLVTELCPEECVLSVSWQRIE